MGPGRKKTENPTTHSEMGCVYELACVWRGGGHPTCDLEMQVKDSAQRLRLQRLRLKRLKLPRGLSVGRCPSLQLPQSRVLVIPTRMGRMRATDVGVD
jgi:hypothetical protein